MHAQVTNFLIHYSREKLRNYCNIQLYKAFGKHQRSNCVLDTHLSKTSNTENNRIRVTNTLLSRLKDCIINPYLHQYLVKFPGFGHKEDTFRGMGVYLSVYLSSTSMNRNVLAMYISKGPKVGQPLLERYLAIKNRAMTARNIPLRVELVNNSDGTPSWVVYVHLTSNIAQEYYQVYLIPKYLNEVTTFLDCIRRANLENLIACQ